VGLKGVVGWVKRNKETLLKVALAVKAALKK
jgi:hypothetical protein